MQTVDNLLDDSTHAAQSCGVMFYFSTVQQQFIGIPIYRWYYLK